MTRHVLKQWGWLSHLPAELQDTVLSAGRERQFDRGSAVFAVGDPPGGAYAIVEGEVAITIAPGPAGPHLVHLARPGLWIGEGAFFTRQPRRVGLEALSKSTLFHLPLDAMDRLTHSDPEWMRRFGQMLMLNVDLALHTIDDLLIPDPTRRVIAALVRCLGDREGGKLAISQSELGRMTNVSRKVVNRVVGTLANAGLVQQGYGQIEVLSTKALARFISDE